MDVNITDNLAASVDLQLDDSSPLAKTKLNHLFANTHALIEEFVRPADHTTIDSISLGGSYSSPSMLLGGATVTVNADANTIISVRKPGQPLFAADSFAPAISTSATQMWIGFEVDASVAGTVGASIDGIGVKFSAGSSLAWATYSLIPAGSAGFPPLFPSLGKALTQAMNNYAVLSTAASVRTQTPGTVMTTDLGSQTSIAVSYKVPLSASALASVDLPFQYKVSIDPAADVSISGKVAISGQYRVRCYRQDPKNCIFGIYKKQGSTLSASFTASAGLSADAGSTDLFSAVMNALAPDVALPEGIAAQASPVIQDSLDRSLSVSLNVACAATHADEAAVVYQIDFSIADPGLDAAISQALQGDWSGLDAGHPGVSRLRNIVTDTREQKVVLKINLLGILNYESVNEFVAASTVLQDDVSGEITITDKARATSISASTTAYSSDPVKLRAALAVSSLATICYVAAADGRMSLSVLALEQSFLRYARSMSASDFKKCVLLGVALEVVSAKEQKALLAVPAPLSHCQALATASYDRARALAVFYSNVEQRKPRTLKSFTSIGRRSMIAVLDPNNAGDSFAIRALGDDVAWAQMDNTGVIVNFGREVDVLRQAPLPVALSVGGDWLVISTWAAALAKVAPLLTQVLAANDAATDPVNDPVCIAKREALRQALGNAIKDMHADFAPEWPMSVVYALAGSAQRVHLDLSWDGGKRSYSQPPSQISA